MIKIILLANWGLGLEVLKCLHRRPDIEIKLVVTKYRKDSSDPWFNAVYNYATSLGYKTVVHEAILFDKLKDIIEELSIDLLISHSFMRIIPKEVFSAPKYGSINIHPSLLPKYRGPSPTQWVLRNSEKMTGLTCHFLDEGVDTGDIIYQLEVPIKAGDDIGAVIERQKTIVEPLISVSLSRIMDRNFKPVPQESEFASYAPRLDTRG